MGFVPVAEHVELLVNVYVGGVVVDVDEITVAVATSAGRAAFAPTHRPNNDNAIKFFITSIILLI